MPSFVYRHHVADRAGEHWDFHLQSDGLADVYKSWAIRKGLPMTSGVKRLAISTADHSSEGARTSGVIKEGYGKGTTEVVDEGEFIPRRWTDDFIEARLVGSILNGTWYLRRVGNKQWLVWKAS